MSDEVELQAAQLAACLDRLSGGQPLEGILADEAIDPETRELVHLAHQMALLCPSTPPAAFRSELQARLQAHLATGGSRPPSRLALGVGLRLVGLIAAVALAITGAVVVSADSTPGHPLYGLKLAGERTRLALARDAASRVSLHLTFADRRLEEIGWLLVEGANLPPSLIDALIASGQSALSLATASEDEALLSLAQRRVGDLRTTTSDLAEGAGGLNATLLRAAVAGLRPEAEATAVPLPSRSAPSTTATLAPTPSRTTTPTNTMRPLPLPKGSPSAEAATPSSRGPALATRPAVSPSTSEPSATTALEPQPTVTATPARPPGTSAASVDARATELARETQRAAQPTATRAPRWPWWTPPVPTASPTAQGGAGQSTVTPPPTAGSGDGAGPSPPPTSGSGCCGPTAAPPSPTPQP